MTQPNESSLPLACFQRRVWERPSEIYLTQLLGGGESRDFTWAQADDQARRMATYLKSLGLEPGSHVAIMSRNCAWWFLADYAIWMAGYVSVPIYPSLTGGSVRSILEHAEAKALFLGKLDSDDWEAMRAGIPAGMPLIRFPLSTPGETAGPAEDWDKIVAESAPLTGPIDRGADELATIMYTSGTTGAPKGVMHSFRTITVSMEMLLEAYGFEPRDRLFSYLPLPHAADRFFSQMVSLGGGCRVFFGGGVETFAADLANVQPTFFISVPRLWTKFRQAVNAKIPQPQLAAMLADPDKGPLVRKQVLSQIGLGQTRYALSGAAPLPQDVHQWYLDLGLELLEVYGMSENLGVSHGSRPGKGKVGYVGQPRPGVEVNRTEDGEILVRGPGTMLGYFKDPERTADAITEDGFLRTGDIGEIDEQGYLKLTGRAKDVFKTSKGKYVAPAPIENALGAHPQIEACCVTGAGFPQPFAVILLGPGEARGSPELTQSLEALLAAVNETLDPHERLDFMAVVADRWTVDNGLMTPTLKVKRAVLEEHYGPQFERWSNLKQPVIWP